MNKKKILKRVLITILIIIAVLALSVFCIFNFYIKPKYSTQIMEAVNELMQDEELMKEIDKIAQDEQLQKDIESAAQDEQLNADIAAAAQNATGGTPNAGAPAQTAQENNADGNTDAPAQSKPAKDPSSGSNKSLMEKAREEASPSDFAAGMSIAGKIDVGYLSGLMKGGLTPEEKQAAKAHITSRLSGSEISKMFSLYSKYSYLLK